MEDGKSKIIERLEQVVDSERKREEYEKDLFEKQKKHLENVKNRRWKPCRHDGCPECHGTGIKKDGTQCVHMLYCDCPKCVPYTL
jgi:hypothetical protein